MIKVAGAVKRSDLFLQTKFTFRHGQDHRLSYDLLALIPIQVKQSFESSLEHPKTDFIDTYLLHRSTDRTGLGSDYWAVWVAMAEPYSSGRARLLGVSM